MAWDRRYTLGKVAARSAPSKHIVMQRHITIALKVIKIFCLRVFTRLHRASNMQASEEKSIFCISELAF